MDPRKQQVGRGSETYLQHPGDANLLGYSCGGWDSGQVVCLESSSEQREDQDPSTALLMCTSVLTPGHRAVSCHVQSTGVMWSCLGQWARGSGGQSNLDSDIWGFCTGPSFPVRLTVDQKECKRKCDRLTSMRTEPYRAHHLVKYPGQCWRAAVERFSKFPEGPNTGQKIRSPCWVLDRAFRDGLLLSSTTPGKYQMEASFPTADRQLCGPLHKTTPSGVEDWLAFKKGFQQNQGHSEKRECLSRCYGSVD